MQQPLGKSSSDCPLSTLGTALAQGEHIQTAGCILWVYYGEQLVLKPRGFLYGHHPHQLGFA